jgi:glutamine synthetase
LCGPPGAHKFELRCVDASANPYLLLASIVAVAIEGVDNQMPLTTSDSTTLLCQDATTVAVIPDELPRSFYDALGCLEGQDTMGKFFGEGFIRAYREVIVVRVRPIKLIPRLILWEIGGPPIPRDWGWKSVR